MTESSTTTTWSSGELAHLGEADEIDISTHRRDGSLRTFVPIWLVIVHGDVYVRSYRGTDGAWYHHATIYPDGAIRTTRLQCDVTFIPADSAIRNEIDAAYRIKYARYGESYLTTMLGEKAVASTLKLAPRR
jgi:hypothetical protein